MSNQVTAKGMKVSAKADTGIVIAKDGDTEFKAAADVAYTTAKELYPASTYDGDKWYYAKSSQRDDPEAAQTSSSYTEITTTEASKYYVAQKFVIRSAAESVAVENVKLAVQSVTVTQPQTKGSDSLDKAIRIGVAYGSQIYIYAPLADAAFTNTASYTKSSTVTACTTAALTPTTVVDATTGSDGKVTAVSTGDLFKLSDNKIPANDTGIVITVYIWYEGEDVNCKSSNITATLDELSITVSFCTVSSAAIGETK